MSVDDEQVGGVAHFCSCGEEWSADLFWEDGHLFYEDEEDAYCPTCGQTGKREL